VSTTLIPPPGYVLKETISVPVDGSVVESQTSLSDGVDYWLRASGVFHTGGPGDGLADAEYADFTNPIDHCPVGGVDLGVGINDTVNDASKSPSWGAFEVGHDYVTTVAGEGAPISLDYHDCAYGDNVGALTVEIFGPADTIPVLPAVDCGQEDSLRSLESVTATSIRFVNQTDITVDVYWLDLDGQRVKYATLAPGETLDQATFLTHPWVVTNTAGTCLGIFLPIASAAAALITSDLNPGCQIDITTPTITDLQPSPGSVIDHTTVEISAVVEDTGSGIDPESVILKLDGVLLSHAFTPIDTRVDGVVTRAKVSYQPPEPLSDDTHTVELSVSDLCGRTASLHPPATPPIPPIMTNPSPSFTLGGVTGGSGFIVGTSITISFTGDTVQLPGLADGTHTIVLTVTDGAGNTTTLVWTFTIDTGAPVIVCDEPDRLWHANNVQLACTASDAGSGLLNPSDASFFLVTNVVAGVETDNAVTDSRMVCDNADHCATAGPFGGNMVDRKAPEVTLSSPAGATYLLNESVTADFACADGGSGVATCDGTVSDGSGVDTASVGEKPFAVMATDAVGNSASQNVNFTVTYNICGLYDPTKEYKANATIAIKLRLCDANGVNVSEERIVVHAEFVTPPATLDSRANPDNNFKYDPGLQGYIYRLSSKGYSPGVYTLYFTVAADPATHSVEFVIR
jgi:hypothetical protein